jgi:hypothetical protein
MSEAPHRRRWQFSLRHFLVAVLIIGPMLGVFSPSILQALRQWNPSSNAANQAPVGRPICDPPEPEAYYESGETPLY